MKMAVARVSAGGSPALLVALLACAAARVAAVVGGSACDEAFCGMGTCKEVPVIPLPVPHFECDCYAGWNRTVDFVPFTPCTMPLCQTDLVCYSPSFKIPPFGSNITEHPCLVMDCGREGTCVEEPDKPFHCQCNSGATNILNNPSFPCTLNCAVGPDGCPVPNPPPPPPSPPPPASPAPPDTGTGSSTTSSSKGNPSSLGSARLRILLLLLLASLAALYVV